MSYTSKYAQNEMSKATNGGDKPAPKVAKKAGKSKTTSKINRLTQGGKKKIDKGYVDYTRKENKKKKDTPQKGFFLD
jgi:hypothetical protein